MRHDLTFCMMLCSILNDTFPRLLLSVKLTYVILTGLLFGKILAIHLFFLFLLVAGEGDGVGSVFSGGRYFRDLSGATV